MAEHLTYWKCPECHGTGKTIRYWTSPASVEPCEKCDGTGNAMVDGAKRRHEREIERIEAMNKLT